MEKYGKIGKFFFNLIFFFLFMLKNIFFILFIISPQPILYWVVHKLCPIVITVDLKKICQNTRVTNFFSFLYSFNASPSNISIYMTNRRRAFYAYNKIYSDAPDVCLYVKTIFFRTHSYYSN